MNKIQPFQKLNLSPPLAYTTKALIDAMQQYKKDNETDEEAYRKTCEIVYKQLAQGMPWLKEEL
jgi:hypothetical protein